LTILRRALRLAALAVLVLVAPSAWAAGPWPGQTEADWVLHDYRFANGEMLPALTLHYTTTLGTPRRDSAGRLTGASPLVMQEQAPDLASADALYRKMVDDARKQDANDVLYATEAVMDYAPEPLLPRIRARILAINSADDGVNPPELGVTAREVAKIPGARFVLIPIGPATRGHLTYEQAAVWKAELVRALAD